MRRNLKKNRPETEKLVKTITFEMIEELDVEYQYDLFEYPESFEYKSWQYLLFAKKIFLKIHQAEI